MITEDYVSFETAKLLKNKGFDGDTNCYYIEESVDKNLCYSPIRQNHNKRITNNEFDIDINVSSGKISTPTLQMAMKWLRVVYNLEIFPYHNSPDNRHNSKWWFEIIKYPNSVAEYESGIDEEVDTYEEACEAAIKYCVENLI